MKMYRAMGLQNTLASADSKNDFLIPSTAFRRGRESPL
jgi:hypothetical protein